MPKTLELLKQNRKKIYKIAEKYGISNIRVFGSVARGEEKKGSDVDLLVKINLAKTRDGFAIIRFEREVAEELHKKVDVISEKGLHYLLEKQIRNEAIAL